MHYIRTIGPQSASESNGAESVAHKPQPWGHHADADGRDVVALPQVITTWEPHEILVIGRAVSQDVRCALELSTHPDSRIEIAVGTTSIAPAHYDLIWVQDRFALTDDRAAESVLRQIHDGLAIGGQLVVSLDPDVGVPSPDSDLFDRWFCFHRTGTDLARLAVAAGFDVDGIKVRKDPASGDVLLIASRDAAA